MSHRVTLAGRDKRRLPGHVSVILRDDPRQNTVRVGRQCLCRHALQRRGAGVLLPAAVPPAGARQAVLLDDHVTHLTGHTVGAVVYFPVVDDTRAHAGTQRDGHKALALASRAHMELRQRRAVSVIFDVQRDIQIFVKQLSQRHVPQGKVAGIRDRTSPYIHRSGNADAYRRHITDRNIGRLCQLLHQ